MRESVQHVGLADHPPPEQSEQLCVYFLAAGGRPFVHNQERAREDSNLKPSDP
jgi:hypothetical protein